MNIYEIREVLRAPVGSEVNGKRISRELQTLAFKDRALYEQALKKVLDGRSLSQSGRDWVEADLEIIRDPLQAVVASSAKIKTEGDRMSAPIPLFAVSSTQDSLESLFIEMFGVKGGDLIHLLFREQAEVTLVKERDTYYYELTLDRNALDLFLEAYQGAGEKSQSSVNKGY